MFLTQFFFAVLSKLSLCVSDWWQFNSNKQLNRGPKWKAPKLRAKQKQRALKNLSETPTVLSNRLTKGRHSVLGHHLVSSPSSANDAGLLFVESEFFWTFYVCWKAVAVQFRFWCMSRMCFVCRGSLFDAGDRDTPWSFHSRVRSAFNDAGKKYRAQNAANSCLCTRTRKKPRSTRRCEGGANSGCCGVVVSGRRTASPPPSPAPAPWTGPTGSTSSCSAASVTEEHLPEKATRGDFHQ